MAKDTRLDLGSKSIYQVFVRNYSEEGTFKKVTEDLERIKDMGFDYLYLMPIHPLGLKNRKGSLGSPYAIKDYRAINPEFGTLDDFKELVDKTHKLGMKVMIDIVLNHTSPDSVYIENGHDDYYYHKADGSLGNKMGEWSDVSDLDYSNNKLKEDLWDMLVYWAKLGVDGYRADVASAVPLDFWLEARRRVKEVKPDFLWLAESVHPMFIDMARNLNVPVLIDNETFEAFDICYDYDMFEITQGVISHKFPLGVAKKIYALQPSIYKENSWKLRYLENHDQPRVAELTNNVHELENWLAYIFFSKGVTFIYNGQEYGDNHKPTLFDKDTINMKDRGINFTSLIKKLNQIRHSGFIDNSDFYLVHQNDEDVFMIERRVKDDEYLGIFNVRNIKGKLKVNLKDGEYTNLIDDSTIIVKNGEIDILEKPLIIKGVNNGQH